MSTQTLASEKPSKALHIGLWVGQVILAMMFGMAGIMKMATGQEELVAQGMAWAGRVPAWLIVFIGLSEVLGAIGLVVPAATRILPQLTAAAAAALALVMVLGGIEHGMAGEFSAIGVNGVLGSFLLFVAWGRGVKAPIQGR